MENRFDFAAKSWDDELKVARAKLIAGKINESLQIKMTNKVLEFGCGTGLITFNMIDNISDVTFVDTSAGMLEVVKEKSKYFNDKKQIETYNDIYSDKLSESAYNCIYTSMALHHVDDIEKLGKRFCQLLQPCGKLCIVDLCQEDGTFHKNEEGFTGHNGFDPNILAELYSKFGFSVQNNEIVYTSTKEILGLQVEYSLFLLLLEKCKLSL